MTVLLITSSTVSRLLKTPIHMEIKFSKKTKLLKVIRKKKDRNEPKHKTLIMLFKM